MPAKYVADDGDNVFLEWTTGERRFVAKTTGYAKEAVMHLNKARFLNDVKRKYTEAARKIAQAEALPGFQWIDHDDGSEVSTDDAETNDSTQDNPQQAFSFPGDSSNGETL
jgi:hypothetical protein